MKKVWTLLALIAFALNFSSARAWAEEPLPAEEPAATVVDVAVSEVDEAASEKAAAEQKKEDATAQAEELTEEYADEDSEFSDDLALEDEKLDATLGGTTPDTVPAEPQI